MEKTALYFTDSDKESDNHALSLAKLSRYIDGWILDGEIRQLSCATLYTRRFIGDKLLWHLRHTEATECGLYELRQFFGYLGRAHTEPTGRWNRPDRKTAPRPATVKTYHAYLASFFQFLIQDGAITASPMAKIAAPIVRAEHIQPFTEVQIEALLRAAKRSKHPRRDEAILLFLLDTGVRASELCGIRLHDLDLSGRRVVVLGKGNKHRAVSFGGGTTKALWQYLKEDEREPTEPLFIADRGQHSGEALTRSGLLQLVERLGKAASIEATRCSPHTFRHTFAVSFLRNGGNVFSLMQILGHTSLHMTNRYVALAQADVENQHRQFSPVDRLKGRLR